ncbi:TadE/TadG family type IV pilus assembly protein [Methylobacterium sp. Leaf456]|uniref:TadE/TadG family type IV pilus assembly protein n=1 Tax=Methylobacterium sp. Leaf456 TaxID=1736382 RepID=UPI0012E39DB2|nr:TadE/TadG family type IV pilus assembly protein [Methylobacterium sp. Leaf456]
MAARTGLTGSRTLGWLRAVWRLRGADQGSVAVVFGVSATALVGMVGGAFDYARLVSSRSHLQAAVDAGVMAGGNALKLVVSNTDSIVGLTTQTIQTEAKASPASPVAIQVSVGSDKTSVTARAEQTVKLMFGPFVGLGTMAISAQAKASVVGKMRLCMLALDPVAAGAFAVQQKAQVTAYDCALYSNSSDKSGMVGRNASMARAQTICSVGGFENQSANFTPNPQTGCPVITDPLRDRPTPQIRQCTLLASILAKLDAVTGPSKGTNVIASNTTINPGTYCGGLKVTKKAVVTMNPGIYVFKDGPLIVDKEASLTGNDVGLFFTGNNSGLLFDKKTTISLAAPTTGPMAGLLMSEDASVSSPIDPVGLVDTLLGDTIAPTPPPLVTPTQPMRIYRIISDNARTMLGTIHLPHGRLVIDSQRPVADMSAYTVVVARQINLYEGPNLYLNANYSGNSVPVPKGVGPVSGRLLLSQ